MSRPIPARLLMHECVLKHKTGVDRNPTYSETALKRVRIGATFQQLRGNIGETKADTLTLFIDAENTRFETTEGELTATIIPIETDAITWDGKGYTVRSVTPCYIQGAATHHWEITLE